MINCRQLLDFHEGTVKREKNVPPYGSARFGESFFRCLALYDFAADRNSSLTGLGISARLPGEMPTVLTHRIIGSIFALHMGVSRFSRKITFFFSN